MSHLPVAVVLWPLASSMAVAFLGRLSRAAARTIAVGASAVQVILALMLWRAATVHGPLEYHVGGWAPPVGIALRADSLSAALVLIAALTSFAVFLFVGAGGSEDTSHTRGHWFWVLGLTLLASMSGMFQAGDLFNLIVMTEVCSLASYGLVSVRRSGPALEASLKYLVLGGVGSGLLLLATGLTYGVTGYLDIQAIRASMPAALAAHPDSTMAALALFTVGYGLKSGLMPLHSWLPDAHSAAPVASSALLSGLVVKVNAFALFKVIFGIWGPGLFDYTPLRTVLGLFSVVAMVVGAVLAWAQTDIKRLLAYSTVGHMGYIFAGFAVNSRLAIAGSMYHVVSHAIMKACLFLTAGLIAHKVGSRATARMSGVGRIMPVTTAAFSLAAFGMIGLPGTSGFVSKYYIALGALEGGQPLIAYAVIISSLVNGFFYLPIVIKAYLGQFAQAAKPKPEAPAGALVPVALLAALVVVLGLWPRIPITHFLDAAKSLLNLP